MTRLEICQELLTVFSNGVTTEDTCFRTLIWQLGGGWSRSREEEPSQQDFPTEQAGVSRPQHF